MIIETFALEEFEEVISYLPFKPLGVRGNGEYVYYLNLDGQTGLLVWSTVNVRGISAGSRSDKIRVKLVELNQDPAITLLTKYIIREYNWPVQLRQAISDIVQCRLLAGDCPECDRPKRIFKSKTSRNKNKLFAKCSDCGGFDWLDEIKAGETHFSDRSKGKNNGDINAKRASTVSPELQGKPISFPEILGSDNKMQQGDSRPGGLLSRIADNPFIENLPGLPENTRNDSSGLAES